MGERPRVWVVDRLAGGVVVLIEDGTEERAEVEQSRFSFELSEGDVLLVPVAEAELGWERAVPNAELRRARLDEARRALDGLRGRDPGGDIVL